MRYYGSLPGVALVLLAVGLLAAGPEAAGAQERVTDHGFTTTLEALATGEEISAQSDLWVLEVHMKPMRMRWVEVTDPETGETTRELIWYLVYKAYNRPLPRPEQDTDTTPINYEDPPPRAMFIPEFTLITEDGQQQSIYHDVILPEAQAEIARRERLRLKNPVEIVQELPPPAISGDTQEQALYGVALFRAVNPETDYFTVYMSGFSNGYRQIEGPDGNPLTLRRVIAQEYWRPGDEFWEQEREFRLKSDPEWTYRPEEMDEPTEVVRSAE